MSSGLRPAGGAHRRVDPALLAAELGAGLGVGVDVDDAHRDPPGGGLAAGDAAGGAALLAGVAPAAARAPLAGAAAAGKAELHAQLLAFVVGHRRRPSGAIGSPRWLTVGSGASSRRS